MTQANTITVIDYHCGNLKSVEQALTHCGADVVMTSDPEQILSANKLVLPGVGAFPVGMKNLHELKLVEPILAQVANGVPLLGICLGMQLLLDSSEEHGGADGLGLIKGPVQKITSQLPNLKLPHIGWNKITLAKQDSLLTESDYFYFVHTYHALPDDHNAVLAKGQYEDVEFCAAVAQDNVWGMQFHPENSAQQGLDLLQRFIDTST